MALLPEAYLMDKRRYAGELPLHCGHSSDYYAHTIHNTHSTAFLPRCSIEPFEPGNCVSAYQNSNPNQLPSNFDEQHAVFTTSEVCPSQNMIKMQGTVSVPTLTGLDNRLWDQTSNGPTPFTLHSPESALPCPRISRQSPSGTFSKMRIPDGYRTHEQLFSAPQQYSPSSAVRFDYRVNAHQPSWRLESGMELDQFNAQSTRSSPSTQFLSTSTSPQSSYSEICEERPRQRRRTALTASTVSGSSEGGNASDSSFAAASITSRSSRAPRSGSTAKSRTKKKMAPIAANGSSAFSTFSVSLVPAEHEPAGATYMSTVDFEEDTRRQGFEHGPTDLPPRPYVGGPDATSPWKPRKNLGTIPGSALDYIPVVENRMARLEKALDAYLQYRGEQAIRNSIVPGMELDANVDDVGSYHRPISDM